MDQKPQLSVLLSFQNQRNEVEPSLAALFELKTIPFELIIIDDASDDGTPQAVQSLLDYYKHDYTFYFEHAEPTGRGSTLNEALQQATTSIVWAPRSFQHINEDALRSAIRNLKNGGAAGLAQDVNMPDNFIQWGERIKNGKLPPDARMLWNLDRIPSANRFFNPFLTNFHATDLLLRLGMDAMETKHTFFTSSEFEPGTPPVAADRRELILTLLRRPGTSAKDRQKLSDIFLNLPAAEKEESSDEEHDLLERAVRLKLEGQLSAALNCVEKVLERNPDNPDAKHLKVKLLERKRRFVEASELKHELQGGTKPKPAHSTLDPGVIKTSLIIPTAIYGKPALEHCLISLHEHCNPATTELIIIDNASLDDTHEYLQELKEKNFFNCRVITNEKNRGFARSVNQGLEAANGHYACIIHNDVEFKEPVIAELEQLMDNHPEYALIGPMADSTLNPDQLVSNREYYDSKIAETDYLDSYCMMIRSDAGLRMDEEYTLAFFDDIDFSFGARNQDYKVGIAPEVEVTHHYGTTTFALDLDTESELYWKNISYFNDKWDIETYSEEELQSMSRFEQLLTLDEWVNPLYPEPAIKNKFDELFTEEMKTEILKSSYDPETLLHLVHLMMVMEKRDVMRKLEDRMEDIELPAALIYEIIRFYFNRNVYSRCQHYLDKLTSQQESLKSDLYRLAILIDEKKMDEAIPLLTEMMDKAPANPRLYKLAGDIHAFEHNTEEADSFYSLAHQINPFNFTETEKELRLNS